MGKLSVDGTREHSETDVRYRILDTKYIEEEAKESGLARATHTSSDP